MIKSRYILTLLAMLLSMVARGQDFNPDSPPEPGARYKLTLKCRNDAAFRALLHETLDAYDAEKLPQKASVILDFNSDGDL